MENTCITYCRVSGTEQRVVGTIVSQKKRVRELADREGLRVLEEVVDDGISGSRLAGRALAGVLERIESGALHITHVVCVNTSRLSRPDDGDYQSEADALKVKCTLQAAGIKILTSEGLRDPADIIQTAIEGAMTRQEKKRFVTNCREGKVTAATKGKWLFSCAPYGFRRKYTDPSNPRAGVTLEVDPDEADRIRTIYRWVADGGYNYAATQASKTKMPPARRNEGGKRKQTASTDTWSATHVFHLVQRAGVYLSGQVPVHFQGGEGTIKAGTIITLDLYKRVQEAVEDRKRTGSAAVHLLTGLASCPTCGRSLNTMVTKPFRYWRCLSCKSAVRAEPLEAWVWQTAQARAGQVAAAAAEGSKLDALQAALSAKRNEATQVQASLNRLAQAVVAGVLDESTAATTGRELVRQKGLLAAEVQDLERQVREAEAQQDRERDVVREAFKLLALMQEAKDTGTKRDLLKTLLVGRRVGVLLDRKGCTVTWPVHGSLAPWSASQGDTLTVELPQEASLTVMAGAAFTAQTLPPGTKMPGRKGRVPSQKQA